MSRGGDGGMLRQHLMALRAEREAKKGIHRRRRGPRLTTAQKRDVLNKTGGKCHICGGDVWGSWHADHVLAHSTCGPNSAENYLPSHATCNNYRWDYLPEEFQLILRLGVWVRTQVEAGTSVGRAVEEAFSRHESRRLSRRKPVDTEA
jgi:hypothetical protein